MPDWRICKCFFFPPAYLQWWRMRHSSATQTLYFTHSEEVQKSDCSSFILLQICYNQTPTSWGSVWWCEKSVCLVKTEGKITMGTFFSQCSYLHTSRHEYFKYVNTEYRLEKKPLFLLREFVLHFRVNIVSDISCWLGQIEGLGSFLMFLLKRRSCKTPSAEMTRSL